jgi:chemotaxis protein histidine kinase CheA
LNLDKASSQMEEALFPQARSSQQFVITTANNLALLLNEALENLEKQQANAQPGDQQCENPGGQGSSGMQDLKESSESLQKQLEKMIQQMKNGNMQGMSQQLGQSLMQHEMMQQMLREMMNNGSVGSEARNALQKIDEMLEQNRKELMSKQINAETLKRQHLITTRLLEAERAELEREFDQKRESESAEDFYSNPVEFFEYKEKENYSIEYLNKNAHKLNNFYNLKYKQYLNNIRTKQ